MTSPTSATAQTCPLWCDYRDDPAHGGWDTLDNGDIERTHERAFEAHPCVMLTRTETLGLSQTAWSDEARTLPLLRTVTAAAVSVIDAERLLDMTPAHARALADALREAADLAEELAAASAHRLPEARA